MPTYLPTYILRIYLHNYLPISDLPTYLPTYRRSTYLHTYCRSTYVPTYPLQIYIRAYLPITDLPTYLPTIADLHTYLPTYLLQIYIPIADLPTQLHTYCRSTDRLMSGISPNSSGKSLKERIHYTLLVNDVPSWNDILVGRHLSNRKSFQIWEHLGHWFIIGTQLSQE